MAAPSRKKVETALGYAAHGDPITSRYPMTGMSPQIEAVDQVHREPAAG